MRMRGILGVALLLAVSLGAWASGTLIYEQGSKASAQAGAFVARADDATAVFYNPAGMAFQKGTKLAFNLTYINADVKYENSTPGYTPNGMSVAGTFEDNAKNFFIPSLHFVMPINDRVSLGLSSTAPFNLATDWSDNFPGRFVSRHAKIVTMDVRTALSFKLDEHHAVAIGIDYYDSKVNLVRGLDTSALSTAVNPHQYPSPPFPPGIPYFQASEGSLDAWVRDQALGWNISYMWNAAPYSIGLTYRSKASFSYQGHASFETSPLIGPLASYFPGQDISFELTSVPAQASFGFAYSGNPLTVEFDANWTQWSTYDQSTVHFGTPTSIGSTHVVADEVLPFEWKDGNTFRLGFGYKLSDAYELRWGILYDQAPVPSQTLNPVLPDADRWSIQFGSGYNKGHWSFDWYAMYLKFNNATVKADNYYQYGETGLPDVVLPVYGHIYKTVYPMTPAGSVYKGSAWLLGTQLSYKW